jgi:hypothetical protein
MHWVKERTLSITTACRAPATASVPQIGSTGQRPRATMMQLAALLLSLPLLSSCLKVTPQDSLGPNRHEHARARMIELALQHTDLGFSWLQAADASLSAPEQASQSLEMWFDVSSRETPARAWEVVLERETRLTVQVRAEEPFEGTAYADLFQHTRTGLRHIGSLPTDGTPVTVTSGACRTILLRVQPELLARGRIRVQIAVAQFQ